MNISNSECSSGCESGWTMYFDQHSNSTDPYFSQNYRGKKANDYIQDDDDADENEDLSMVSDASSGPPSRFHKNYGGSVSTQYYEVKKKYKNKTKETKIKNKQSLCLDDTASSPILQDNVVPADNYRSIEHVPGFSAPHFESESMTSKHLGFFKSSTKGKSGGLMGRKRP